MAKNKQHFVSFNENKHSPIKSEDFDYLDYFDDAEWQKIETEIHKNKKKDSRSKRQKVIDWLEQRIKSLRLEKSVYETFPQVKKSLIYEGRTIEDIIRDLETLDNTLTKIKKTI